MSATKASEAQIRFITSLVSERIPTNEQGKWGTWLPTASAKGAADAITKLKEMKLLPAKAPFVPKTEGFYSLDGEVYRVKKARGADHLYVTKMRETGGLRLADDNTMVHAVEFDFIEGGFKVIKDAVRIDQDTVKELCVKYRMCLRCERNLKAAQSVERGIGPICITKM